MTDIYDFIVA